MDRTSIVVACEYYGVLRVFLSVDPACQSKDEADALCAPLRAKMSEGYHVLCGRHAHWMSPWPNSDLAAVSSPFASYSGVRKVVLAASCQEDY
jgi:hypothetical protein